MQDTKEILIASYEGAGTAYSDVMSVPREVGENNKQTGIQI